MSRYFVTIVLFILLMTPDQSAAQLNPDMLTFYNEIEGTTITNIISDDQGNIWLASMGGLMKFDGYELVRFHPDLNDSTTMGELLTYVLYKDEEGNLWIGGQEGIYFYNNRTKTFKRYLFDHLVKFPDYALAAATAIVPGIDRIYFGISSTMGFDGNNALIYWDKKEQLFKSYDHPDAGMLQGIYNATTDLEGNIYLMDVSGGYTIDRDQQLSRLTAFDEEFFRRDGYPAGFVGDSSGKIWITTHLSKLVSYDPRTDSIRVWPMHDLFLEQVTDHWLIDMAIDPDQQIWIASRLGLISFDPERDKFTTFQAGNNYPLKKEPYTAIHFDGFGNLWTATDSDGLIKYSNRAILHAHTYDVQANNSITFGWIMQIIENTKDGSIWFQSFFDGNGGINRFDTASRNLTPFPTFTLSPGIRSFRLIAEIYPGIALAHKNSEGYALFNFESFEMRDTVFQQIPDSTQIITYFKDTHGISWFGTYIGVYADVPGEAKFRFFDLTTFLSTNSASNEVSRFFESARYGLWIFTSHGLFSYNYESNDITRHAWDPEQGDILPSQDINSFYESPDGILWVGTWQGGLCRYDVKSGKIKTYAITDGLASMSIQGILADEKNNALWLSTFSGISRFDLETEKFNNFTVSDGMQGLLYADFSYLKSTGNLFFFGGNNGVTFFNPDKINQRSLPPNVFITEFKVADQVMEFIPDPADGKRSAEMKLSHDQNSVSFEYTGIQYDNPAKNQFSYTLENYDDTWRNVKNLRSAFYYNLPPGSYTFRVKAANSIGVWNEKGSSLHFTILPPWWRTWWAYVLYGVVFILAVIALDRIQRRRILEKQKRLAKEKELEQAREIERAYHELKRTQQQLVHAEKMASLGELTAGIAHEIQNPLNFVNNFSEVNAELISELKEEVKKGDMSEVLALAEDIAGNEQKIMHHGKRADAIVKNMLQHSRAGGDEKVPTDINALAEEYLRLSYHGLRAKDKSFNADFASELDPGLPKIKVVPQDIGRVLLNIINNAFHAVGERAAKENGAFKPFVTVKTEQKNDRVIISVNDNGLGIPENIRDKIFQPFFTTKSAGDGTGLGLSLSYDIVTKGHNGVLELDTEEGKGSTFRIIIPINS